MDCYRRRFLKLSGLAAAAPFIHSCSRTQVLDQSPRPISAEALAAAKVAIVNCISYGSDAAKALNEAFDLLGGIGRLVRHKTVTVKVNLTTASRNFESLFDRPAGETYVTHGDTAASLAAIFLREGAHRVRFVESSPFREPLEEVSARAGWDVPSILNLGRVEFENTRNLGKSDRYARLTVPSGGHLFEYLELNHSYADTDVFVSLAKLKNHKTAGVTLSLKNLFGLTPNALYGDEAPNEDGVKGRGRMHQRTVWDGRRFPGGRQGLLEHDAGYHVPRVIADISAARRVDLAIVDGITAMAGGEGPWTPPLRFTEPGVIIAGLNPVSTDAVCVGVMGYSDPRAATGTPPYEKCSNTLKLAEDLGVGTADLSRIEVLGSTIEKARYSYAL
jgi:uncharacterized protein (DUF362 family)